MPIISIFLHIIKTKNTQYSMYEDHFSFAVASIKKECAQNVIVAPYYHILVHHCVTERYHSLSHTPQPQPALTLRNPLCVEIQPFSCVRVSDGLLWFWTVSSDHPCVYSKVSGSVLSPLSVFIPHLSITPPYLPLASITHPYAFL